VVDVPDDELNLTLIALRSYTRTLIRRYLYARYQAARVYSSMGRRLGGRASCRPIRTFEDALVFVIDMDRCLDSLNSLDRDLVRRVLIQDYTEAEAAVLFGMSARSVAYKLPAAIDRLTQRLIHSGLLIVPEHLRVA
jgi:DNA-directed RNA polymerase specialized sigma24 family protein